MLESIRQYGAARLDSDEGDALRGRHLGYYTSVTQRARVGRADVDQAIIDETDNLRSAVHHAIDQNDAAAALAVVASLHSIID